MNVKIAKLNGRILGKTIIINNLTSNIATKNAGYRATVDCALQLEYAAEQTHYACTFTTHLPAQ